jgi:hypothetical protein
MVLPQAPINRASTNTQGHRTQGSRHTRKCRRERRARSLPDVSAAEAPRVATLSRDDRSVNPPVGSVEVGFTLVLASACSFGEGSSGYATGERYSRVHTHSSPPHGLPQRASQARSAVLAHRVSSAAMKSAETRRSSGALARTVASALFVSGVVVDSPCGQLIAKIRKWLRLGRSLNHPHAPNGVRCSELALWPEPRPTPRGRQRA